MLYNPLKSWTLRFLLDHWKLMSLGSAIRYRNFIVATSEVRNRARPMLMLRMRQPINGDIWLRRKGSDTENFQEIVIKRVYNAVTDRIQNCKYVIDLGANIGLATRLFAARYPSCRILAVEPHLENYELLEKNVTELAKAGRCRTVRAAVWDRKSRLAVAAPPEGEDRYFAMFVQETLDEGMQEVEAVTMNELIEQSRFPVVDILKVDIEGAEVNLFRGDLSWLSQVHTIAIEFHGDSRERSGFDAIMEHHAFQIENSMHHTIIAVKQTSPAQETSTHADIRSINT